MKKRILALFLCIVMIFALAACGGGDVPATDSHGGSAGATSGNTDAVSTDDQKEEVLGYNPDLEHKVIACDIKNPGVVIFDLNKCNGDFANLEKYPDAVVWEWYAEQDPNCKLTHKIGSSVSGVRYRYSEYYKKDVIVACCSYGWIGVIDYETRSLLWETDDGVLSGLHSVEMLPNGDIVGAVSTDPGAVVYYPISAGIFEPVASVPSLYCHGVFWDPEMKVIWALENYGIVGITISGMGTKDAKLVRFNGLGANFMEDAGGHAFAPVLGEPGKYWATASKVWQFDTKTMTYKKADDVLVRAAVKGICSFEDGTVVQAIAGLGGTNNRDFGSGGLRISVKEVTGNKVKTAKYVAYDAVFHDREFYKVQSLTKNYQ